MRAFSRRALLGGAGALAAGAVLGGRGQSASNAGLELPLGGSNQRAALAALGRTSLRTPGSLPNPSLAPGIDTMPGIEHIVVLMMENHSYDNLFGMLPSSRTNGVANGGFDLTSATNPRPDGLVQHTFRMPATCQLPSTPSQEWTTAHDAYHGGKNDGFVTAPISFTDSTPVGPVAMGYWTGADLPFIYSLAETFPIADQWFCSLLGQTDPNRRYLIAATSSGMTDDTSIPTSVSGIEGLGVSKAEQDVLLAVPAAGTIFDLLSAFGISWADYTASYPTGTTAELYPVNDAALTQLYEKPVTQFAADCASGSLPQFSLIDPNFSTQSQENPQDISVGEAFMAGVVEAIGSNPKTWASTLLIINYDEHGGYYDHVPPPPALAPDLIGPVVQPGQSTYDGFNRYGFRVPALVASPYAVPGGVSHVVHDHASILAMVERKWNLPALTYRDANANDLTDLLDMNALAKGKPNFATLPALASPGASNCPAGWQNIIPPPGSVTSS